MPAFAHNVLERLVQPMVLDAPWCADHDAAVPVIPDGAWPLAAAVVLVFAVAWAAHRLRARRALWRLPRWAAAGMAVTLLVTLPYFSLHASHHWKVSDSGSQCALAAIGGSTSTGVMGDVPALAPPQTCHLRPAVSAARGFAVTQLRPTARAPPAVLSSRLVFK